MEQKIKYETKIVIDEIVDFLCKVMGTCLLACAAVFIYRILKLIFSNINILFSNMSYCVLMYLICFVLIIVLNKLFKKNN